MSLKLEVGKTYLDGYGNVVKILHYTMVPPYPYWGDSFRSYTDGGLYINDDPMNPYNLFTEHNPEDL